MPSPARTRNRAARRCYTAATYEWHSSTGHLIGMLHHGLRRALDVELARWSDVSSAQWIILMILMHQDDVTAAALARRLNYDPGSMTRLLDRLQDKGLIRRARAGGDRRRIKIELTETGRKLSPSLPTAAINVMNLALTGISAEEHRQLNGLLSRMIENVS